MRTFGLVFALLLVVAGACSAGTVTAQIDLYPGMNIMALPNVPLEIGHDDAEFGMFVYNPYYLFGYVTGEGPNPEGVQKIDTVNNATMVFANDWNMLLGEGYLFQSDGRYTLTYEAIEDGVPDAYGTMTDMWISLPGSKADSYTEPNANPRLAGGGVHLIGHPFAHATSVAYEELGDNLFFTDGTQLLNWQEAIDAGWVDSTFQGLDAANNAAQIVTPDTAGGDLMPGRGYYFRTFKDDLALIVPAS